MAADDELTQRERRAQRHQTRGRDKPAIGRSLRAYGPVALIVLAAAGALGGMYYLNESASKECVSGHWHATFGIFIPGAAGDPVRVDFAAPRTPNGINEYYDFTSTQAYKGAPSFSMTLHMHQDAASPETGGGGLGPAQWHMEQPGKCTGVRSSLRMVDVLADSDSLELTGGHTQIPGQSGEFLASESSPLRWWLQTRDSCNVWNWHEKTWDEVKGHQMQDGESLLGALGNYTDAQVSQMQSQIPAPISRVPEKCQTTTTSAPTTTAMATTSETSTPTGNATTPA